MSKGPQHSKHPVNLETLIAGIVRPGDTVQSHHEMRAWAENDRRGMDSDDVWIGKGAVACVIQVWGVGERRIRMRVLHDGKLKLFSCSIENFRKNWSVI